MSSLRRFRYPVSPLECVVLIHHVLRSPDAENDADRTVSEIASEIDTFDGYLSRSVLESALYCCNMEQEAKRFWHPMEWTFNRFVTELLPVDQEFNSYYNRIVDKEKRDGHDTTSRR